MWVCGKWVAKVKKNINFLKVKAYVLIARKKKLKKAGHCALYARCRIESTKRNMTQIKQERGIKLTGNTGKPMDCVLIVEQDHSNTD